MTRRCRGCGRPLRLPSLDGYGPVCRRRITPAGPVQPALPDLTPVPASAGQIPLEEPTVPTQTATQWNQRYPVGTPVHAYPGLRPEDDPKAEQLDTRTRSRAEVLGGHTDVVWVEGHGACIALTHVNPTAQEDPHVVAVDPDAPDAYCRGCGAVLDEDRARDLCDECDPV